MMHKKLTKTIAITAIAALVAALALAAAGIISWKLFWLIILVCGSIAYFVIPRLRKISEQH